MRWRERRTQLKMSSNETNKDITNFGEELQLLHVEVADRRLDEAMRQDYQQALDAYSDAKVSLDAASPNSFGVFTEAAPARVMQFALRYEF